MILKNRKVFQSPNAMVTLGQSKTNCHSYSMYLNETLGHRVKRLTGVGGGLVEGKSGLNLCQSGLYPGDETIMGRGGSHALRFPFSLS